MIELFPQGFEEAEGPEGVELAAYTDASGEERLRAVFEGTSSADVVEDWADRWRAFHRPVRIGPVWIGPPWEERPADAVTVVIDPGRAFGTGGHPTTRLCIELLLGLRPESLLDLGCGSGVIAIAAAKLGFEPVFGFDIEGQAVEATLRNAAANGVRIDARLGDALTALLPETAVVVANIEIAAVSALAPRLPAATAIVSGYVESELPQLPAFAHLERRTLDGWAADLFGRE